jgi:hypothetical protein
MSLAYIGTMDRKEVTMLVSLFSIHVSKLYMGIKMADVIEIYSKFEVCVVLRFLQAEGVSESDIHHGKCLQAERFQMEGKEMCGA